MSRNVPVYSTSYTNARPQRISKHSAAVELVDKERRFTILVLVIILFMFISIPFILLYKRRRAKSKPNIIAPNVLGSIDTSSMSSASNDLRQTMTEIPAPTGMSGNSISTTASSDFALDKNKLHNIIDKTDAAIRSFY